MDRPNMCSTHGWPVDHSTLRCPWCMVNERDVAIADLERKLEEATQCRETGNYSPIPCPNCGRVRVLLPVYECEKCDWTPDIGYEPVDEIRDRAERAEADNKRLREALDGVAEDHRVDGPCWCNEEDRAGGWGTDRHKPYCERARAARAGGEE